jgi:hypothetical protein
MLKFFMMSKGQSRVEDLGKLDAVLVGAMEDSVQGEHV